MGCMLQTSGLGLASRRTAGRPKKSDDSKHNITRYNLPELNRLVDIGPSSVLGNTKKIILRGQFVEVYPSIIVFMTENNLRESYRKLDIQLGLYKYRYVG